MSGETSSYTVTWSATEGQRHSSTWPTEEGARAFATTLSPRLAQAPTIIDRQTQMSYRLDCPPKGKRAVAKAKAEHCTHCDPETGTPCTRVATAGRDVCRTHFLQQRREATEDSLAAATATTRAEVSALTAQVAARKQPIDEAIASPSPEKIALDPDPQTLAKQETLPVPLARPRAHAQSAPPQESVFEIIVGDTLRESYVRLTLLLPLHAAVRLEEEGSGNLAQSVADLVTEFVLG